jgi:hypothetical protein
LQFLDRADGGSHGQDADTSFRYSTPQFLECGGFSGAGRPANSSDTVSRTEDKRNGSLLLRPQSIRRDEHTIPAERFARSDSPVHAGDHAAFPFEACFGGYLPSIPQEFAGRFPKQERALEFVMANVPAPVP